MRDRTYQEVRQTALDILANRTNAYRDAARTMAEEWLSEFEPLVVVNEQGQPRALIAEHLIDQPRRAYRVSRPREDAPDAADSDAAAQRSDAKAMNVCPHCYKVTGERVRKREDEIRREPCASPQKCIEYLRGRIDGLAGAVGRITILVEGE